MQNLREKYRNFTVEDLLNDDDFIRDILSADAEIANKWKLLVDDNIINRKEFEQAQTIILSLNYKFKHDISAEVENRVWEKITADISNNKKIPLYAKKRENRSVWFLVASIALVLIISLAIVKYMDVSSDRLDNYYTSLLDEVTVEYDDAVKLIIPNQQIIVSNEKNEIVNTSEGEILVSDNKYQSEVSGYNHLITPYGKQSKLILEDGTVLWANANSRIIYPAKFEKNRREIFIEGEVFADVAKDSKRPFVVKTVNMDIEVLGTSFNVNAYRNEDTESVTLVTGLVRLKYRSDKDRVLNPNQQFTGSEESTSISNVDVTNCISWIDGYYRFKEENLIVVLHRLSKFYGYEMTSAEEIQSIKCTGGLDLKVNIDQAIAGLARTLDISYHKNEANKTIIFTKK